MTKPGYKTSEHAITWAIIALSTIAMFRNNNSVVTLLAPALASAAYSHSRGRAKSAVPFDARALLHQQLLEAFKKTSSRTNPASASANAPVK